MTSLGVVIPAFNAEESIERAIRSAWASGADEVLVVDDGSQDRTSSIAAAQGATVIHQENAGAAAARKAGAAAIRTEAVTFLDADDELIADGVRRSLETLGARRELAVAAGVVIGVGAGRSDTRFPVRYQPVTTESLLVNGYGPWPPAAAVVRVESYNDAQAIEPPALAPRYAEDYELLIRLSMVGGIDVRDDPTCRYSLAGGKSARSARAAILAKEDIRRHYARYLGITIREMTDREVSMAARVRTARAQFAAGQRFAAGWTIVTWAVQEPRYALRTLRTRPWRRN